MSGNTLLDIDSGEDSAAAFMLGDFNNGLNNTPDNRPIGTFTMSGGVTNVGNADRRPSWSVVGGSGKGTLSISGGTFNAWILNGLNVGDTDQNGFAGEGALNLSGTGSLNATELWFGKIGRATGTMNQTGGSVTVGIGAFVDRVATGAGGGPALNPEDNAITLGGLNVGVSPALEATAVGTYNISAGTVHAAKIIVGNAATGVWNQAGGSVTVDGALSIARVINDYGNASIGTVNLNGGTMAVGSVAGGAGNSTLNLNGGILKPLADNATFITGVTSIVAGAGGAKIDTSGFTIATDQQITGGGSLTKQGAGTLSLSAALVHNGGTKIDGGSLRLSGAAQTSALTAPGDIDIRNGKLVLDYTGGSSPEAQVVTILTTGYNQATKFSSGKLKNTTASASEGLGWVANTANSTVTIGAALYGDADLSGTVNFDDLLSLAQNYGATGTGTWSKGDSTYDTNVNFDDLLKLAQNYGGSLALEGGVVISTGVSESFANDFALALSLVPEPTSLLGAFAVAGVVRRRRV
jgi:autotransporter-associated beta strand protein